MSETQKQSREKAGYIQGTRQSPSAQVMPLNGIAIGIAMWEIVSWIIGIKKPEPWLYYDAMQNKLISMKVTQNPECTCCSLNEKSILATGDHLTTLRMIKDLNQSNKQSDNFDNDKITKEIPLQKNDTKSMTKTK